MTGLATTAEMELSSNWSHSNLDLEARLSLKKNFWLLRIVKLFSVLLANKVVLKNILFSLLSNHSTKFVDHLLHCVKHHAELLFDTIKKKKNQDSKVVTLKNPESNWTDKT